MKIDLNREEQIDVDTLKRKRQLSKILTIDSSMLDKIVKFGSDFFGVALKFPISTELPNTLFDGIGSRIMCMLVNACNEDKVGLTAFVSTGAIFVKLNQRISRSCVTKRMKQMAEWGFITVDTHLWKQSKYFDIPIRESSCVTLNEGFKIVLNNAPPSFRRDFMESMMKNAQTRINRGIEEGFQLQGFKTLVKFGNPETEEHKISDLTGDEELFDDLEEIISDKEMKAKLDAEWRIHEQNFVDRAASVWIHMQECLGFGSEQPIWAGDTVNMTAAAKRERSELVKTLREYGGAVSAVAWSLYCGFEPKLDKSGKNAFDPSRPHVQCVFNDKRPSQFSKNFVAILKDREFRDSVTSGWSEILPVLTVRFGDLMSLEPKKGSHYDKLGYRLGDSHIRPDI